MLGATLWLSPDLPPRAYIRLSPRSGGKPVALWSNVDLRLLQGISRFAAADGTTHDIFMVWSAIPVETAITLRARRGLAWTPPA